MLRPCLSRGRLPEPVAPIGKMPELVVPKVLRSVMPKVGRPLNVRIVGRSLDTVFRIEIRPRNLLYLARFHIAHAPLVDQVGAKDVRFASHHGMSLRPDIAGVARGRWQRGRQNIGIIGQTGPLGKNSTLSMAGL